MGAPSSGFRADVQGLRALAVLLVALDHADVGPFRGGFVGVDVFFVVSGFLITSLLLREAESTGRVSLRDFYARRARRILPAALLVLLATLVLAVGQLDGATALRVGDQAVWVTFFAANVAFARESTDYFAAGASESPLLHYWSLAVEEQFYVVWPLLVLAAVVLLAGRLGSPRRAVGAVLLVLTAGSLAWSVHATATEPLGAYFSTPARACELGLGSSVAVLAPRLRQVGPALRAAGAWLGLALVLSAGLVLSSATPVPGYAALLPCGGAALLLAGGLGAMPRWSPQPLLSLAPLQRLGDWSYSFYLWHWPLLVVAAARWGDVSGWTGAAVLAVAVLLSAATYRWVETPFREARVLTAERRGRLRSLLLYPASVALALATVAGANRAVHATVAADGPPITVADYGQSPDQPVTVLDENPVIALVEASLAAADNGAALPADLRPDPLSDEFYDVPEVAPCDYLDLAPDELVVCPRGEVGAERRVVVIGDSHARQWIPALERIGEEHGYEMYFLVRQGCPAAAQAPWDPGGDGPNLRCAEFQDWVVDRVAELQPVLTLLATDANEVGLAAADGSRVRDDGEVAQLLEDGMVVQIGRIQPHSRRVVVLGDPPVHDVHPAECLTRRDASVADCVSPPQERSLQMIEATRRAAQRADAGYLPTAPWFCVEDRCPTVVGPYVTHRDPEHITVAYAEHLAAELARRLRLDRWDAPAADARPLAPRPPGFRWSSPPSASEEVSRPPGPWAGPYVGSPGFEARMRSHLNHRR